MRVERGRHLAAQCPTQDFDRFLVGVGIRRADVRDETAGVGNDVMLRAGRDLRHGDADGAQQGGAAVEAESTQAGDVVECDIERVDALVAGRMAAFLPRASQSRTTSPVRRRRPASRGLAPTIAMSILPSAGSRARMPCSPMHSSSAESASRRLNGRGCARSVRKVCVRLTAEAPASLLPRP